jgi:hypothetical protein
MSTRRRRLSLVKGPHRFVFQYQAGGESGLVGSFLDLARDPDTGFDWYDAAVLSFHMGRQARGIATAVTVGKRHTDVSGDWRQDGFQDGIAGW